MPRKKTGEQETFEIRLTQLEEVVRQMESGEMSLADMLAAYEKGMKLAGEMNRELDTAEKRMQEVVNGKAVPMEDAGEF